MDTFFVSPYISSEYANDLTSMKYRPGPKEYSVGFQNVDVKMDEVQYQKKKTNGTAFLMVIFGFVFVGIIILIFYVTTDSTGEGVIPVTKGVVQPQTNPGIEPTRSMLLGYSLPSECDSKFNSTYDSSNRKCNCVSGWYGDYCSNFNTEELRQVAGLPSNLDLSHISGDSFDITGMSGDEIYNRLGDNPGAILDHENATATVLNSLNLPNFNFNPKPLARKLVVKNLSDIQDSDGAALLLKDEHNTWNSRIRFVPSQNVDLYETRRLQVSSPENIRLISDGKSSTITDTSVVINASPTNKINVSFLD